MGQMQKKKSFNIFYKEYFSVFLDFGNVIFLIYYTADLQ